jgi:uncharacterized Zn finger protein
MPESVEAAFRREDVSLFPMLDDDLELTCTCEDWSMPCRHALAASLLVGEAMDADPLLAFKARGIEPALLMAIVASGGAVQQPESVHEPVHDVVREPADVEPAEQLEHAPDAPHEPHVPEVVTLDAPPIDAPLVRILGAPPMWRGADSFEPAMRRLYARVASDQRTIELALRD